MEKNDQTTRLHDLRVKEVSLVDHPANEEVFLIIKQMEGGNMLQQDSPVIKASEKLVAENDENKQKNEHYSDDAMKPILDAVAALVEKVPELAESDELKNLMAAIQSHAQAMAASESAEKGMHGNKEDKGAHEDDEEEKSHSSANKMDHKDKEEKEEKEEKSMHPKKDEDDEEKGDYKKSDPTLSELRDLLATLHSKLSGPAQAEAQAAQSAEKRENAIAKAIGTIGDKLTSLDDRLNRIENTRGHSRSESDSQITKSNDNNLFKGLI